MIWVKKDSPLNVAKVKSTIRGWKVTYIALILIVLALIVLRLALPCTAMSTTLSQAAGKPSLV